MPRTRKQPAKPAAPKVPDLYVWGDPASDKFVQVTNATFRTRADAVANVSEYLNDDTRQQWVYKLVPVARVGRPDVPALIVEDL